MPSAQTLAGISKGLSGVASYERERPAREARMAEAKMRQRRSELELQEFEQNAENRQALKDIEVAQMKNQLFQLQTKSLQDATYSAFKAYNADQDTRHLNTFLQRAKANPASQLWDNWARFDALPDNKTTRNQLAQAGYDGQMIDAIIQGSDDPKMPAFVLATDSFGNQQLVDVDKLEQASGYTRHMQQQELEDAQIRAQIARLNRGTMSADTQAIQRLYEDELARNPDYTYSQAAQDYFDMKNSQRRTGTAQEREADRIQAENPEIGRAQALRQATKNLESRTSAQKDIDATVIVRERLHALNPEKDGTFYEVDLSDPAKRARAGELITDLEHVTGKKLTGEEKRVARQLRSLLDLGNTAGQELTEEETGIIDNMMHNVRKYFDDNIGGIEGTTSYHAFRNVMRNALMGATLTTAEIKAFDRAAGTLNQQLGPVLGALRTSMVDVRNQLRSMANDLDPMQAKYYLGSDVEQAERAIDAIDQRLMHMAELQERSERAENLTVKELREQRSTIAPKVNINVPAKATPDGTQPPKSIDEFWSEKKG